MSRLDRAPHRWILDEGQWCHRPWWKVAANTVLRLLQPGRRKWVFFTHCEETPGERPRAFGYGFGPIVHKDAER